MFIIILKIKLPIGRVKLLKQKKEAFQANELPSNCGSESMCNGVVVASHQTGSIKV